MKAKVISTANRSFFLSTSDRDLGVTHSLCSLCGSELETQDRGGLRCTQCGNIEHRKLSPDYGKDTTREVKEIEN